MNTKRKRKQRRAKTKMKKKQKKEKMFSRILTRRTRKNDGNQTSVENGELVEWGSGYHRIRFMRWSASRTKSAGVRTYTSDFWCKICRSSPAIFLAQDTCKAAGISVRFLRDIAVRFLRNPANLCQDSNIFNESRLNRPQVTQMHDLSGTREKMQEKKVR